MCSQLKSFISSISPLLSSLFCFFWKTSISVCFIEDSRVWYEKQIWEFGIFHLNLLIHKLLWYLVCVLKYLICFKTVDGIQALSRSTSVRCNNRGGFRFLGYGGKFVYGANISYQYLNHYSKHLKSSYTCVCHMTACMFLTFFLNYKLVLR